VDEDSWAHFEEAIFSPLANDDADLAARLSAHFLQRLVGDMSATERADALRWKPPRFEVGVTPSGGRVLGIHFGGRSSVTEWDGTVADAECIVDSFAETSAADIEWDYWVQGGGWKEWKGDAPPTP